MGDAPRIYELGLMTSPEVRDALPNIACLLVPVGSCEQHGPHIALSSDAGQATAYSRLLAQRMHPRVAIAPTIPYGLSEHHMHFPGTSTLTPDTFIAVCTEAALGFSRHGLRRVLFMNGHGGNRHALSLACDLLYERHGLCAAHVNVGELGVEEEAPHIYQGSDVGHACEFETSSAMHLCPELVREAALTKGDHVPNTVRHTRELGAKIYRPYYYDERTRNGCLGDASQGASAQAGRAITERGLTILCEFVEDFATLSPPSRP